jgi:hypothetical protein
VKLWKHGQYNYYEVQAQEFHYSLLKLYKQGNNEIHLRHLQLQTQKHLASRPHGSIQYRQSHISAIVQLKGMAFNNDEIITTAIYSFKSSKTLVMHKLHYLKFENTHELSFL